MSRYRCHLFDVDGTLVDSSPTIRAALKRCLADAGVAEVDEARLGVLAKCSPLTALKSYGISDLSDYWRYYEEESFRSTLFFEDTRSILRQIKAVGASVGVVSSLKTRYLRLLLDRFGLLGEFGAIIGWNDCPQRKPNPAPILMALEKLRVPPFMATYTGDSESDMAAAIRAGVAPLYADWGGGMLSDLRKARRLGTLGAILEL